MCSRATPCCVPGRCRFSAELFNNLGLCCFYAQQFDMALGCFERALGMAEDEAMADVWYNLSHIAIGLGDVSLCYHCLKLAVCCDPTHAEAYNNLGTLGAAPRCARPPTSPLLPRLPSPHVFGMRDPVASLSSASPAHSAAACSPTATAAPRACACLRARPTVLACARARPVLPAVAKTNAQPAARHARPAEHSKKNHEQARAHYTSAQGIHESQYNSALLASELGDFKTCFNAASEALETFHVEMLRHGVEHQSQRRAGQVGIRRVCGARRRVQWLWWRD